MLPPSLKNHIEDHHTNKEYKCYDCNIDFVKRSHLFKHRQEVHGTRAGYNCEQCNFWACTTRLLNDHKRTVHEKLKIKCGLCSSVFSQERVLKKSGEFCGLIVVFMLHMLIVTSPQTTVDLSSV